MSVPADLPRTDDLTLPLRYPLYHWRGGAAALIRRYFDLDVVGAQYVPATGPVIVAANHVGVIDGPLLAILSPRPVHVLTKHEMFAGPHGGFMAFAGQIPVERDAIDVAAVRRCVNVLRAGLAVGVFPEGNRGTGEVRRTRAGAAYLAMVTGAPVVPLAFIGTRAPGGSKNSLVPRGSRVVMQFGQPVELPRAPWPRRRDDVRKAGEQVRLALLDTVTAAKERTGMSLPGSIPGDEELDRE